MKIGPTFEYFWPHGAEGAIHACTLSLGGAIAALALSRQPILTAAALPRAAAYRWRSDRGYLVTSAPTSIG